MITLVWLKILNPSFFTTKLGLNSHFTTVCAKCLNFHNSLCAKDVKYLWIAKNLSAILTVLEKFLVVQEINIQPKFSGRNCMISNFLSSKWDQGSKLMIYQFYLITGLSLTNNSNTSTGALTNPKNAI